MNEVELPDVAAVMEWLDTWTRKNNVPPDKLLKVMLTEFCMALKAGEVRGQKQKVWVRDAQWVKLDAPLRCRRIDGSPKTHCQNMTSFGLMRSNGVWAYCEKHMYGQRINNGQVEFAVYADSEAAKQGWV